jgi:hypothetical protein
VARGLVQQGSLPEDPDAALRRALRDLVQGVLREHLQRPLQSLEFFRKMSGSGAQGRP